MNRSMTASLDRLRAECKIRLADASAHIDQSLKLVSDSATLLNIAAAVTRANAIDHVPTVER